MGIKSVILTLLLTLVSFTSFAKQEGLALGYGNYDLSADVGFSSKSANLDDFSSSFDYSMSAFDIDYVHFFGSKFYGSMGYTSSFDSGDLDGKTVGRLIDQSFYRVTMGIGYAFESSSYEVLVEGTNVQADYIGKGTSTKFEDSVDDFTIYIMRTTRYEKDKFDLGFDFGGFIGWTDHEVGVIDMLDQPQRATIESTQIGLIFEGLIAYNFTDNFDVSFSYKYKLSQEVDSEVSLNNGYKAEVTKAEYDSHLYSLNASYKF